MKNNRGQVFFMTALILVTLSAILPLLINLAQNESRWTVKEQKSTRAFHLSEMALERGYQQLLLTTSTWTNVTGGASVPGFNFDTTYTDPSGGEYQIQLSSTSGGGMFVTAVGRDGSGAELRALRAEYAETGNLFTSSIYSAGQVNVNSSANVEWGSILAKNDIDTNGRYWPRYYSTGKIDPWDTNPAPPNTNNRQWWSYYANMPVFPTLDLNYYKTKAQALGAAPAACGGSYYVVGNVDFRGCNGGGAGQAGTWYITGNAVFKAGMGGNYIVGDVIALGNLEMNGNGGAFKNLTVPVPPTAWKEYGGTSLLGILAWVHYKLTFDLLSPLTYDLAVATNYKATGNATINNILVNGLMYQGGNFQATGSGNAGFYGVVLTQGQPTLGSNMTLYFNPNITIQSAEFQAQRVAWEPPSCVWPKGGNASCQ
jgi:hypothetical protein